MRRGEEAKEEHRGDRDKERPREIAPELAKQGTGTLTYQHCISIYGSQRCVLYSTTRCCSTHVFVLQQCSAMPSSAQLNGPGVSSEKEMGQTSSLFCSSLCLLFHYTAFALVYSTVLLPSSASPPPCLLLFSPHLLR